MLLFGHMRHCPQQTWVLFDAEGEILDSPLLKRRIDFAFVHRFPQYLVFESASHADPDFSARLQTRAPLSNGFHAAACSPGFRRAGAE